MKLALRSRWATLASVLLFMSSVALSADDTKAAETEIEEIVVVANKFERPLSQIAANVTVLNREDIRDTISSSVADIFRYTPGIDFENAGTRFGDQGINIRGISGNRVAVLVDGVPLSDGFQVGSFSNATRDLVNAGLVQRLEVLHGPASALYGSAAIGGVVAFRTPDPSLYLQQSASGGELQATWRGVDESLHGTGLFAFGRQNNGLLAGLSVRDGGTYESNAVDQSLDLRDYQRRSALLKYVYDSRAGQTWRISYRKQESEVRSDLNSMLGTGRYRSTTALLGDDRYSLDVVAAEFEFGSPDSWIDKAVVRAYYQWTTIEQATVDERAKARTPVSIDRYFEFDQDIAGVEINLQKHFETGRVGHQLGFGMEYREKQTTEFRDGLSTNLVDGTSTKTILGEVFPLRDFPVSDSTALGVYLEDSLSIGDLSIIVALRGDQYDLRPQPDPMYQEDYPFADPVSLSESDISPKLGVIYRLADSVDLYAQYSHGFRSPPYEDANIGLEIPFFNYRAIPNPELRSETSQGFDIGLRWRGAAGQLRFSAFRTEYTDFIESKARIGTDTDSGRILFQSRNLAAARIEGVEVGGALDLSGIAENLFVDGAMYVARGVNEDTGEPLNSVGPPQAIVGFGWKSADARNQARLQTTITGSWDRVDESAGEQFKPASSMVFDFFFTRHLGEKTTLRAGITNLTDKTYWSWTDVRGLSPDDPVLPYLAKPGRTLSLGLDFTW